MRTLGAWQQQRTAKRIFERLRDENGFTMVKDYVRLCRARSREIFVPLAHPPGHAQANFGEAVAVVSGEQMKIHYFCMSLPQWDACFIKAYRDRTAPLER